MTEVSTPATALSQRLKTETADLHERMHQLMARAEPFASRERYARFVAAQYLFQQDVEHLFEDPAVQTLVRDLAERGRATDSRADLLDLQAPVPQEGIATEGVTAPEALGWLYVSEGSTLGAAFLLKEVGDKLGLHAGFGARNLAAYPEGRARAWKRFVAALDAPALSATHDRVIDGARAAYGRFGQLLEDQFGLATQSALADAH
ncbi:MAG TPA: biliverdin-producing heme oxygenase [Candidatus Aquabacterium excrementipullorum]|nr:biliverdin-producing heme oxygenase [Candidatus Aquabacterium excrementipullorum]